MDYLYQYGLFLAQAATIVVALYLIVAIIAGATQQLRGHTEDHLEVKDLNRRFEDLANTLNAELLTEPELKARKKEKKKEAKQKKKAAKRGESAHKPRLFVLDFEGDIRASLVENLREEISTILQVAAPDDQVLLRLESPGGMVHGYGLAASQLRRLRERKIKLVAAVDKVAASGGYMMACVADKIIAAPFAVIGSIGVVGQLPNFNRWLKEKNIDYELHTAGEHKRTLTLFGENTDEGREKFREELQEAHDLFKAFVSQNRPQLEMAKVATGDHWFGSKALELGLVDEIKTSDDYLLEAAPDREIYKLRYKTKMTLTDRLAENLTRAVRKLPF